MNSVAAGQLDLHPTGMTSDGDAVARDSAGRVVFIGGALPGENVRVEIVSERPKSATGRLIEILESSPQRIQPPCPEVARGCGGCQWQHIDGDEQRRLKAEIVTNAIRRGGIEPPSPNPTVELPPWGFRTTIRTGVLDGRAGFRKTKSHDVLPVDECLVAHPLLAELLDGRRYAGAEEVLLRCGARTGERLVDTMPSVMNIDVPEDVRRDHLHESAAGRLWRISADSFFQTRPDGVDVLARLVVGAAEDLGTPTTALDLFSGVGLFAGVLAERGWSVTAVEKAPSAVVDARANLRDLDVKIVAADVSRWKPAAANFVIADPSRIGLGSKGVDVVVASGAHRLVLVSCDAISLARDAALLCKHGYLMTALTQVDLFPQTFHVEVVTIFDR